MHARFEAMEKSNAARFEATQKEMNAQFGALKEQLNFIKWLLTGGVATAIASTLLIALKLFFPHIFPH